MAVRDQLAQWNRGGGSREKLPGRRLGGVEVAKLLSWTDDDGGVHEVKPSNLQHINDLPPIVQWIAAGKLWLEPEIVAFAEVYQARQRARHARRVA